MRGGTLFSGIGAPECAMPWVDWRWAAEIDPFASAVLAARFPHVRNLWDVNAIGSVEPVELVVFGSPCQSFSVAGKRLGLDDPRGNLALVALRLIGKLRPSWVVFENVPGLLSSDGGRDFGALLGLMGECGYGFAYRVLDAQHFGIPQRRRRVFVVGYLGDWRPAAAVLFEPESLRGDSPPRREAGQDAPGGAGDGSAFSVRPNHHDAAWRGSPPLRSEGIGGTSGIAIAHSLRADGFDASEGGTGRGTPLTLAIRGRGGSHDLEWRDDGTANAILTPNGGRAGIGVGAVAIQDATRGKSQNGLGINGDVMFTLDGASQHAVGGAMSVRRLLPVECERLQGFPDDWTLIPYRGTRAADGPRYRAIGNSMAVPVVRWIGERIRRFEEMVAMRDAEN